MSVSEIDLSAIEQTVDEQRADEVSENVVEDIIHVSRGNGAVCPQCDKEFERLTMHWSTGSCSHPEIPSKAKEILTGLMMGDGSLHRRNRKNQRIQIAMTNRTFLEALDDALGWISNGVRLREHGEEIGQRAKESGFSPNADVELYRDYYCLATRSHPWFSTFDAWYESSSKVIPSDVTLTYLTFSMWYVSDGNIKWGNKRGHPVIHIKSYEAQRLQDALSWSHLGVNPKVTRKEIRFGVQDSKLLFKQMYCPEGFEYKFETESFDKYQQLKEETYNE